MDDGDNHQLVELIKECEKMEKDTGTTASLLKVLSILFSIIIILSGTAIGIVSSSSDSIYKYWVTAILGFMIAALKGFISVYKLDSRAITNMQISIKMRQFIRKLRKLRRKSLSDNDVEDALDKLGEEFDLLKFTSFTNGNLRKVNTDKPSVISDNTSVATTIEV